MRYETFETWESLLAAAATDGNGRSTLYYHAPLDCRPAAIHVVRVYKNGKIRIRGGGLTFTCDAGHLSRFRKGVL